MVEVLVYAPDLPALALALSETYQKPAVPGEVTVPLMVAARAETPDRPLRPFLGSSLPAKSAVVKDAG